jgi:hypothetical protein
MKWKILMSSVRISYLIMFNYIWFYDFQIKLLFHWADTTFQLASLVNLLVFLTEGKHPTLVDRIVGLQPVSVAPPGQDRAVGYSYMTRELLWHGLIVSTVHISDI